MFKKWLKEYLISAIQDYAKDAITEDNLKAIIDYVIVKLESLSKTTDTTIDDWVIEVLKSWMTDKNISTIFNFIKNNVTDSAKVYGCCPKCIKHDDYEKLVRNEVDLALKLENFDDRHCSSISLSSIISILEIVLPLLYKWVSGIEIPSNTGIKIEGDIENDD